MKKWDKNNINDISQGIVELNIFNLKPFKNHPFKLYEGQRLYDMVESIKEHGIITPIIVRKLVNGEFEILSGHNRVNAAKLAGLNKAPVVIKENITDEEAMLIVTETNVIQRSFWELSHSEKARVIAERHNAIKNQGRRTDLINEIKMLSNTDGYEENSSSRRICEKTESDIELGRTYDLSPRNISNYLRIDMLTDDLKIRLDNDEIPFTAGVNISFLTKDQQESVESILKDYGLRINIEMSEKLKKLAQNKNFTDRKAFEVLKDILQGKPKQRTEFTPKFTKTIIEKYVTGDRSLKDIEVLLIQYLERHFDNNNGLNNEE